MPQIHCLPDDQLIDANKRETILKATLANGIPHTHVCGGSARCSTCRVLILEGLEYCNSRTIHEQLLAHKLGFPPNIRLACQTKITGDVSLRRLVLDSEDVEIVNDQFELAAIGEEKLIAILFGDLRGFTKFSESMLPYDVVYVLNRYFNRMNVVVNRNDGIINNFMGDGFMAFFGLEDASVAAADAVRAGVEMLEELVVLNHHLDTLYHRPLKMGIGIHFGLVVLGAVGASHHKSITAIGDAVNFASRIESANKEFGTEILISEDVYKLVKEQVEINNECMEVSIRGKSGKYRLYEVKSLKESARKVHRSNPQGLSRNRAITSRRFRIGGLFRRAFDWIAGIF
jgi:adenylate cyclase